MVEDIIPEMREDFKEIIDALKDDYEVSYTGFWEGLNFINWYNPTDYFIIYYDKESDIYSLSKDYIYGAASPHNETIEVAKTMLLKSKLPIKEQIGIFLEHMDKKYNDFLKYKKENIDKYE